MAEAVGRSATDVAVVGATRGLIGYLRDLVLATTTQVRDVANYESVVWLGELPDGLSPPTGDSDIVLDLAYEPPPLQPEVPSILNGQLQPSDIGDPLSPPRLVDDQSPQLRPAGDETKSAEVESYREDRLAILLAFRSWLPAWQTWAARELASRPRRALYAELARRARQLSQQDDQYEAVLAVGLLSWKPEQAAPVQRHLITRRAELQLDRRTAKVTVSLVAEAPTRLEDRDFLDADDGHVAERTVAIRERLQGEAPHPLSGDTLAALQAWHELALDEAIDYETGWQRPESADARPRLSMTPAVVIRRRDWNALVEFYDRLGGSLAGGDAVAPLGLAQLLFSLDEPERLAWAAESAPHDDTPLGEDPLFPRETNQAQRDVLTRLSHDTAVVVQGPPGTGKTHTIANLVSALLAQGQRVLVTSQKDQALRVLRDKLPAAVRNLCVLLADARAGSDELERSITALSDHAATSDATQIEREIERLSTRRAELRSQRSHVINEMSRLREADFTTLSNLEVQPVYGPPPETDQPGFEGIG